MNANRFEAFLRSIDLATTRRATLGVVGASLALATRLWPENAVAKKKRKKKKTCKGSTKKKCGKNKRCVNLATSGANCGACGHGCLSGGCVHGVCTCESSVECPIGCVCDLRLDGGSACRGAGGAPGFCSGDADCPIGSFCLAIPQFCSVPCQG